MQLRRAIEHRLPGDAIGSITQELVDALGGTADLRDFSPSAAAVYLIALMLSQPPAEF
jgi:hypothetical protein